MKAITRRLGLFAALFAAVGMAALAQRPARAQIITFPQWLQDSASTSNPYLVLFQYARGADITRWNLWTGDVADPFDIRDNFFFILGAPTGTPPTFPVVWPWGTRLFSGLRPTQRIGNAGDDRPYANHVTLHVRNTPPAVGFTDIQIPTGGTVTLQPPAVTLPNFQGFFDEITVPAPTGGLTFRVIQKQQFARDLLRCEVSITNNTGTVQSVGVRMALASYADNAFIQRAFAGAPSILPADDYVFIPATRERVLFEREFIGAAIPTEIQQFDDEVDPVFVTKQIFRGNGATPPSRLVIGNMLNIFPFVLAGGAMNYDYVPNTNFELRISDIGTLIYWDPVDIQIGQTVSFVTYCGLGVADHGMSSGYQVTPAGQLAGQGFIGAVQTPFALPLINGNSDIDAMGNPIDYPLATFVQNIFTNFGLPNTFAFIDLPPGLQFMDGSQSLRVDLGSLSAVGTGVDEGQNTAQFRANGFQSGLLPVNVAFQGGFGDTARLTRRVNVPQGRLYQILDTYRMLSFPFNYPGLANDPTSVLGIQPGSFLALRWNPIINQYEQVTILEPGKGYWVRSTLGLGTRPVRLQNAVPVKLNPLQQPLFLELQNGWNQMGIPSPYAVPLRDLLFFDQTTLGNPLTFDQAAARGWFRSTLFRFDLNLRQYVPLTRDAILQPGEGFWIFATGQRFITFPAPRGPEILITP
jgi:hypothetical protein